MPEGCPYEFPQAETLLVLLTVFYDCQAVVHPKYIDDEGAMQSWRMNSLHGGTLYISALDREATAPFLDLYSDFFCHWPLITGWLCI